MQQGLEDSLYHQVAEYEEIGAFSEEEKLAAQMAERFVFDHAAMLVGSEMCIRVRSFGKGLRKSFLTSKY